MDNDMDLNMKNMDNQDFLFGLNFKKNEEFGEGNPWRFLWESNPRKSPRSS